MEIKKSKIEKESSTIPTNKKNINNNNNNNNTLPKPIMINSIYNHKTEEIQWEAHENQNKALTDILEQLGNNEKNKGSAVKYKAYMKAAKALKNHGEKITSGAQARKLDGIGAKIQKKIDEILTTGQLQKLENELKDEKMSAVNEIASVTGIGAAAAKKFYFEDGIRSVADLHKIADKLNHHQQIGLKYYEELKQRIPRDEMKLLEKVVLETLHEIDPKIRAQVCGSYRRGAASSGDIDFLITHPEYTEKTEKRFTILSDLVALLKKKKFITDDIADGKKKYMGVCMLSDEGRIHRRIDLRMIPFECYPCGLLYFTGSDYFNQQMRMICLEKGFTLSEYYIFPIGETGTKGEPLPVTCEKDIFDYLGMKYKEPHERSI